MTNREEFDKWFNEEFGDDYAHTEAMLLAWQARGELDAVRIKELEAKLDKVKRVLFLGKAKAEANERYLDELASECSDPNL
jgi:hypothetical protein